VILIHVLHVLRSSKEGYSRGRRGKAAPKLEARMKSLRKKLRGSTAAFACKRGLGFLGGAFHHDGRLRNGWTELPAGEGRRASGKRTREKVIVRAMGLGR